MTIARMVIDPKSAELVIEFTGESDLTAPARLSFEYLRVCTLQPEAVGKGQKPNLPAHKKQVALQRIESVGKHGFRFCFDDGFQAIYSEHELLNYFNEYEVRWQQYLQQLKDSGLSREATISITQL